MRTRIWMFVLSAALLGCEKIDSSKAPVNQAPPAPDNTAVNRRDADGASTTPADQGENEADRKMTAEIRKRIIDTPDLSVNARNAKVITTGGKVTLRGPVSSESERDLLDKIAVAVAGEGHVENQLEVTPQSR